MLQQSDGKPSSPPPNFPLEAPARVPALSGLVVSADRRRAPSR